MTTFGGIRSTRRGQTPAVLLLAVFALLLQSLLPAAALAAQAGAARGETVVVCTQMGVQTIKAGETGPHHKGFAGLPCQDCLAAAVAAVPAPAPLAAEPAAYVVAQVEHAPAPAGRPHIARAPPRPPGQGPPQL